MAVNVLHQSDDILAAAENLAWRDDDVAERSYGRLVYQPETRRWVISGLEPQVAIRVKRMFPRISLTQVGLFGFSDSDEMRAELEWFLARYPLEMSVSDRQFLCDGRLRFERLRNEIEQVFKYSNIGGWADVVATGRFRSVIFDEVQSLRHGFGTDKGRAAKIFADSAALRIGLSATPIFGYGGEMFHVVDFIEPGALGSKEEFIREWCVSDDGKMIVKDAAALGAHLYDLNLLLREIGKGPPPNRIIIDVPYDEDVAAADEAFARSLAIKVLQGSFTERGQASRELDMFARRITGVAKARHVAAYIKMLLDAKTPVILGGWHRDVYDIWLKELAAYNPVLYTGSESPKQKDAAKHAFMSGQTDIIIMSLRSGAGLDGLQHRCATVAHGELDWSREVHKQLAGRLRPHARADAITELFFVADGGSDPAVAAVQGLKASQAHGIVDPKRGVIAAQTDESRMKTLARMYLERAGIDPDQEGAT